MKIMKFGGTSVGSPERMKSVSQLIASSGEPVFVVLSAMSGTTNSLVEICNYLYKKNPEGAADIINRLEQTYDHHVEELYSTDEYKEKTRLFLKEAFRFLRSFTHDLFTSFEEKNIVAQGEILSTNLVVNYMQENGMNATLLPALDFMRTDKNSEPDINAIRNHLSEVMSKNEGYQIYITQGFICRNTYGEVDNLLRGGSDYTASIIGAAINAEEIQIWTDIDGMHNNDPRVVEHTEPVRQLHFDEAAELAYFGAKILHPTCIRPAKFANIPVRLKYTMEPDSPGTIINNERVKGKIKAIAAKDNITAVKVKSSRMLLAAGFLRKVFEIFESYQTPIDMVTTSEVGVSMSVDNAAHLNEIVDELKKYGTVTVDTDMCTICIVGDLEWNNIGFETLATNAMRDIPVRMIAYGGSNYNISFLIRGEDKKKALKNLSDTLFWHIRDNERNKREKTSDSDAEQMSQRRTTRD
ncbi:MAG: aspartate kinase [Prevotella sp.]|nr:aspartate kinase [Prevotella sp.]